MDFRAQIDGVKQELGERLCILAHHYQQDAIVDLADFSGDSLELARKIPGLEAEYVVMCGVYFMAESAAILSTDRQKVFIPDEGAGCFLADMARAEEVEQVLNRLNQGGRKVVPLAYVNTSAKVKAVCARFGGSVCTSANAVKMLDWALSQGDGVLFLPDRHLARNTALSLGLDEKEWVLIDKDDPDFPEKRLYLWPGYCNVHDWFALEQIEAVRKEYPGARIIVHPECAPEVVGASDASGSTSKIIAYVQEAPRGSEIIVGTEKNLVLRLAAGCRGKKTVIPLKRYACKNMAMITLEKLAGLVTDFESKKPVTVDPGVRESALQALETMLAVCR